MKQVSKQYILGKRDYDEKMRYILASAEMPEYGYVTVGSMDIEFEVPDDFNPVQAEIAMLKENKAKIEAEAWKKMALIDDAIGKLQCLTHNPEV